MLVLLRFLKKYFFLVRKTLIYCIEIIILYETDIFFFSFLLLFFKITLIIVEMWVQCKYENILL